MENTTTIAVSYFDQKHALAIRIWHWVTFGLFAASIVMVLLAKTLFVTKGNIAMVQDQIKEKGGMVTAEQARNVAHEYNDKLWNTHKLIGYFLCFALLSRVVIEVAVSKEEKMINRLRQAKLVAAKKVRHSTSDAGHYAMVKYLYLIFYGLFIVMAVTGLMLAFEDVEFLKPIHRSVKSLHEFIQYCIYGYIVIHLVGVIRADVTVNPGIVSRMINSGKA